MRGPIRLLACAAAMLSPGTGMAAPLQPVRWSLHPPSFETVTATLARSVRGAASDALAAVVPDPGGTRMAGTGLRLAPMISNILNSRRVSALEQVGAPGSGEGYLRGVHRTIGLALRKPIL